MPFQPARGLLVEGRVPMSSAGRDKFLASPVPRHRAHGSDSYRPRDDRCVAHRAIRVRLAYRWLPKVRPEPLRHPLIVLADRRNSERGSAVMAFASTDAPT